MATFLPTLLKDAISPRKHPIFIIWDASAKKAEEEMKKRPVHIIYPTDKSYFAAQKERFVKGRNARTKWQPASIVPYRKDSSSTVTFDVEANGEIIGDVSFFVFTKDFPFSARNFFCLWRGINLKDARDGRKISYLGSRLFRFSSLSLFLFLCLVICHCVVPKERF